MNTSTKSIKIPLSTKDQFAIIDFEDLDRISQYGWSVYRSGRNFYAVYSRKKTSNKPAITISMHRLILGLESGQRDQIVDHINGDGLDNRKSNLRICTQQENLHNQGKRAGSASRFMGVFPIANSKKWSAKIFHDGKTRHIGSYLTEELAAAAYDEAAQFLRGEFARLNFPKSGAA